MRPIMGKALLAATFLAVLAWPRGGLQAAARAPLQLQARRMRSSPSVSAPAPAPLAAPAVPATPLSPRVRKELRSLTESEYSALVDGLRIMMNTSTEKGQQRYGPRFKEYDYFLVKHATAACDPRGDQAHNGNHFMTYHRAWLLELERCLLAIAPQVQALPYADWTMDLNTSDGRHFGTNQWLFSPKYVGGVDCASGTANSCQVHDGVLANRRISRFNRATYNRTAHIYNGSLTTGLLRGPSNTVANPNLTRYTADSSVLELALHNPWILKLAGLGSAGSVGPGLVNKTSGGVAASTNWNLTKANWLRCTDAAQYISWTQWSSCIDLSTYAFAFDDVTPFARYASTPSAMLHLGFHWIVGGAPLSLYDRGDMSDLYTSPNDALAFLLHHANLDRNAMRWQMHAAELDPSQASAEVMWGYPRSASDYPAAPGTFLHDTISSNFPFDDLWDVPLLPASPAPPEAVLASSQSSARAWAGVRHIDMLNLTAINSVYRYDTYG